MRPTSARSWSRRSTSAVTDGTMRSSAPICRPTASSTARRAGSTSTSGCSSSPRNPRRAVARAGPVPRDLRDQPRRVLHGPGRRSEATDRHGHRGRRRRAACRRASSSTSSRPAHTRWRAITRECSSTRSCPRSPSRHRAAALGRARRLRRAQAPARFFDESVYPVLTPLAVDPAHPFPYISGLSLNLAVVVRDPTNGRRALRAGEGAGDPAAVPASVGERPLRPDRRGHCRAPAGDVPRHGGHRGARDSGSPATKTSRSTRTTSTTSCRLSNASCVRRRFGPPVRLEVEATIEPAGARSARARARH